MCYQICVIRFVLLDLCYQICVIRFVLLDMCYQKTERKQLLLVQYVSNQYSLQGFNKHIEVIHQSNLFLCSFTLFTSVYIYLVYNCIHLPCLQLYTFTLFTTVYIYLVYNCIHRNVCTITSSTIQITFILYMQPLQKIYATQCE